MAFVSIPLASNDVRTSITTCQSTVIKSFHTCFLQQRLNINPIPVSLKKRRKPIVSILLTPNHNSSSSSPKPTTTTTSTTTRRIFLQILLNTTFSTLFTLTSSAAAVAAVTTTGVGNSVGKLERLTAPIVMCQRLMGPVDRYISEGAWDKGRTNVNYCTRILAMRKNMKEAATLLQGDAYYDALDIMGDMENIMSQLDASLYTCLLYTSPSPRDQRGSRMPSSA